MSFRLFKLRFRRVFRRRKQQISDSRVSADKKLEQHVIRRLHHLWDVKRFVGLWAIAVVILIGLTGWQTLALTGYFQHLAPVAGGIYREGIIGGFTNANPIYATSAVDRSVSRLIFASLFRYNSQNQLVGDLAENYDVSKDGRTYTVTLRPHLTWQDGQPLTAHDVAFTYHMIQNAATQSPLASSWAGVTVEALNDRQVSFMLPNPLASFIYNLTNGIIPKHILGEIDPGKLRSANFNTVSPVGAGPFSWGGISIKGTDPDSRQELIALSSFDDYHAGAPKLGGIIIHTYSSQSQAVDGMNNGDIDGLSGLERVPASLQSKGLNTYYLPLTAETMVFFKNSAPVFKDAKVRQALVLATDRRQIVSNLPYPSRVLREPLLPDQLGYDPHYIQPAFNLAEARSILASDNWQINKDGYFTKDKTELSFNLYALDTPESRKVAAELQREWRALGANVQVIHQAQTDFSSTLSGHDYDAVLHTVSIGIDPDVYIYWDSSQADPRSASRLNLSEYDDSNADLALEAGRTRQDPKLRAVKYGKFLAAWQKDYPALALYQPSYLYVTSRPLYNFYQDKYEINSELGRYNNVVNWEIRESHVTD